MTDDRPAHTYVSWVHRVEEAVPTGAAVSGEEEPGFAAQQADTKLH